MVVFRRVSIKDLFKDWLICVFFKVEEKMPVEKKGLKCESKVFIIEQEGDWNIRDKIRSWVQVRRFLKLLAMSWWVVALEDEINS